MKVTIRDIAERAGVSLATVSNALNNRKGVNEENRTRIMHIARQMGYKLPRTVSHDDYIRLVMYKRNGQVLTETQYYQEIIAAIEEECRQSAVELQSTTIDVERDNDYMQMIKEVCREECAGILVLATEMRSVDLDPFLRAISPIVLLDNIFPHIAVNAIAVDNESAGYMATQRLLYMGHRRIGHITYNLQTNNTVMRRRAYEQAMRECGVTVREDDIWKVSPGMEEAYADMKNLLKIRQNHIPTAFFACNDITAAACIRALQDSGLRVPEDVSIIGMDDLSICVQCNPPFSSVRVLRKEMGKAAVRRIMDIKTSHSGGCVMKTTVDVELIERQSILDLREDRWW